MLFIIDSCLRCEHEDDAITNPIAEDKEFNLMHIHIIQLFDDSMYIYLYLAYLLNRLMNSYEFKLGFENYLL